MKGPSTIHRYPIDLRGSAKISVGIPRTAPVALFGRAPNDKSGHLSVWFQIPTQSYGGAPGGWTPGPRRRFEVVGTGHPIERGRKHLASAVDGMFVWHLLEVQNDG